MFDFLKKPEVETAEQRRQKNQARRKKEKKRKKQVKKRIEAKNNPGWLRAFFRELPPFRQWPRKYYLFVLIIALLIARLVNLSIYGFEDHSGKAAASVRDDGQTTASTAYEDKTITLGSTGAMIMHSPILDAAEQGDNIYSFDSIFKYITPYYSAATYMTCEFEGTICTDDYEYSGYPLFRCPESLAFAIRNSGIDMQMLATNHIYDGLADGVTHTEEFFRTNDIATTGVRANNNQKRYSVQDVQGIKIGFFDYTYETEGQGTNINSIEVDSASAELINTFKTNDLASFYEEVRGIIDDMKADGAQFIVANLHWGEEYQLTETDTQDQMAQKLCNMGVDALIGGHPHCLQPIDVLTAKDSDHQMFCIYSEGNALSNQRQELMEEDMDTGHTEDGVIITLTLHQDTEGKVTITGVDALPTWVCKETDEDTGVNQFYILPLDDLANIETTTGISGISDQASASYERTMGVIGEGLEKAKMAFSGQAETTTETETGTGTETETEIETGTGTESDTETEAGTDIQTEVETDTVE